MPTLEPVMANTGPADELVTIREQMKLLQHCEAELRATMLADPAARSGRRFVVSVKTVKQKRIDGDLLRRDYPQIAAAVTVEVATQQLWLSGLTEDGEVVPLVRPGGRQKREGDRS
jgi:hypothetical protein